MLLSMTVEDEERRATEMLSGKTVKVVRRHRAAEVMIEFSDNTRLFVDAACPIKLSITDGFDDKNQHPLSTHCGR
ncbi:MAG TPA: hypothetical protein VGC56_03725 [Allosphingosinicella sp.]